MEAIRRLAIVVNLKDKIQDFVIMKSEATKNVLTNIDSKIFYMTNRILRTAKRKSDVLRMTLLILS